MWKNPAEDDTILMLHGLRDRYEAHHKVTLLGRSAGETAVRKLSSPLPVTDRRLPDKAIDLDGRGSSQAAHCACISLPPDDLKVLNAIRA